MLAAAPSRSRGMWPLAAICCLGILCLLIAGTIVLALIPIYLPTRQINTVTNNSNDSNIFYLEYSADANPATSQSGSLTNTDEIGNALGFGNDAEVVDGFVKTTNDRRKRSLLNRRQKRTPSLGIALRCRYKMQKSCNTESCKSSFKLKLNTRIQQLGNINNLPCSVLTAGVVTTLTISVRYVAIVTTNFATAIVGYGAVDSLSFVAIQDGDFYDSATWLGGVVPFAKCSIVISAGITVSIARAALTFPLTKFDVFGSIAFGAGSSTFQFNYAINIAVHSGGVVQDSTSTRCFRLPGDSLVTSYSGGSFCSAGTVVQTYSSAGLGSSITVPSASGPFTCGVLPSGNVVSFPRVTFIVVQSGGFTSGSTYLGGVPPSTDACSDGCGVDVPPGVTLSTADLDGELDLNIVQIDVSVGAFLELGTGGSSKGFRFKFPVQVNVLGSLSFVCSGGGIYIPSGNGITSSINFFGGSSFTSVVVTFIQVVDLVTGVSIGTALTLQTTFIGPYFITISVTGTISISVIGPGGNTVGSTTIGSTTAAVTTSTASASTSITAITNSTASASTSITAVTTSTASTSTSIASGKSSTVSTSGSTTAGKTSTTNKGIIVSTPSIG